MTPPASVHDSGETLTLSLSASHVFEVFEDTKGNLVASTKQYYYQIADPDGSLLRFLHREFDVLYLPDENAALKVLSEIYKQHTLVRSWADES